MRSKVFFVDARSRSPQESLLKKMERLLEESGVLDVVDKGDLVAIKIHFGEPGNYRFIRPQFVRVVVEKVKEKGGVPFVTDTTGVGYQGARGDAKRCLEAAYMHGYTPETLGAPIVVADGMLGFSGVKVRVDGIKLREVEIASAIADADALISVAHAKGHPRTGLGGALKNLALGCVTKRTKAKIHLTGPPKVDLSKCDGCGECVKFCPLGAIDIDPEIGKAVIDESVCAWGCGCWSACPRKAISGWFKLHFPSNTEVSVRVADAAKAVIDYLGKDKVSFVNVVMDVTPHCDCFGYGDLPIVPDIGILASMDPVAIDKASIDLINQAPGIPGSAAEEIGVMEPGKDKLSALVNYGPFKRFLKAGPPDWKSMLEAAVKLGLGSIDYELVKLG